MDSIFQEHCHQIIVDTVADSDEAQETKVICAEENFEQVVGPNCRINIVDRHEIERLNQELEDAQQWFEEYGQNGILFPNSIINAFAPVAFWQAA